MLLIDIEKLPATIVELVYQSKTFRKEMFRWEIISTQCPNFSAKSQNDLNYHIAKKHGATKHKTEHTCKQCKMA